MFDTRGYVATLPVDADHGHANFCPTEASGAAATDTTAATRTSGRRPADLRAADRARLHAALDTLLDAGWAEAPTAAPPAAHTAALHAWHTLTRSVEGAALAVLPRWAAGEDWAADGAPSPAQWTVAQFGLGAVSARAWCRTARLAAHRPHIQAALREGRLSREHAHDLVRARRPEIAELFDRDEAVLVGVAADLQLDAFRTYLHAWRLAALEEAQANDPDRAPGPLEEADRVHLSRTFGGRTVLGGELGPEAGAELRGAIDAEVDALRRTGQLSEAAGTSTAEVQAAALLAIVRRGAIAGTRSGAPRPSLIAIADLDTLLRRVTHRTEERLARRAEILDGGPVATAALQRLLCDADLSLVITDADRRPLWVGRARRTATAAQRTALLARSGGRCEWPGCSAPPAHCRAHHLLPWSHGGSTDLPNLVWLCNHHHAEVHRQGFQLRLHGGRLQVRRPDGREVRARCADPWPDQPPDSGHR